MQPESENWRKLARPGQKFEYAQPKLLSLELFASDYFTASAIIYTSLQ